MIDNNIMSVEETEEGLEIVHLNESKADMGIGMGSSMDMYTGGSTRSTRSNSTHSDPASLKSNYTCSLTEFSGVSTESNSFELEYSDEDLSIVSSDEKEEENEESKTRDARDDLFDLEFPSIWTLDLVIDEIPAIQNKAFVTSSKTKSEIGMKSVSSSNFCQPTSTDRREKVMACPCCRSYVKCEVHSKKDHRFPIPSSPTSMRKSKGSKSGGLFTSFVDGFWSNQQNKDSDSVRQGNTSPSVKSMGYTVKRRLMEGWLDKKGTGNDIFGSTVRGPPSNLKVQQTESYPQFWIRFLA